MRTRVLLPAMLTALVCAAPAAAATWSPSVEAIPAALGGFGTTTTLLDDGRTALGWYVFGRTSLAFAPAGGPFGPPAVTSLTPPKDALAFDGAIARDGTAVVVYRAQLHYRRVRRIIARPDGTTTRPRSLSTDGHTADGGSVAFAPDGSAIAAWRRYNGTHWQVQFSTMPPDGDFGPAQTIDSPGRHVQAVTVAAAGRGAGVVAWMSYPVGSRRVPVGSLSAHAEADLIAGGTAGEPQRLGGAATPQLGVAANGRTAVVAWARYRSYEDQSVEVDVLGPGHPPSRTTLVRGGGNVFGPVAGLDDAEAMTVAWSKFPRTGAGTIAPVSVATSPPAAAFGAPQVVSGPGESANQLALASRGDGAALLAWQGGGVVSAAVRPSAGETFGAETQLSPADQPAGSPVADLAPDGRIAVAWNGVGAPLAATRPIWVAPGRL